MKKLQFMAFPILVCACLSSLLQAQNESPFAKSNWKDNDGKEMPNAMTIVDYGVMPLSLSLQGNKVLANNRPTDQLSAADRRVIEAVTGYDISSIAQTLKEQRRPSHIQVEYAVLRQIDNGQLTIVPVALLAPDDRLLAMQVGRQLFKQRQFLAQVAAAQVVAATTGRRPSALAVATNPIAAAVAATMGANYEQEGQFEGQFGDQSGPDLPGGIED